jgi:Ser/Thr protein kinase RdoA (MazF antagonist)
MGEMPDLLARLEAVARAALPRFEIAADAPLALLHHRENAVFRVDDPADGRPWVVRVHRQGYRTTAEIRSELAWMDALREAGLPTPRPRGARDGACVQTVALPELGAPHDVDVLAWIDGQPLDVDDTSEAYRLVGRTSAFIHRHARQWMPPATFSRPVWDLDGLVGRRALWGWYGDLERLSPDQRRLLDRGAEAARHRLEGFGRNAARFGLTHGDLMPENILVADGVPHVIDFDDGGWGWHLYDLATLLGFKIGAPDCDRVRDAWVEGYRSLAPLSDDDLTALDALVMARMLLGLGWMHTRRETPMARDFTDVVVHLACAQAEALLGGGG